MTVKSRVFQSSKISWEALCEQAAEFATGLGHERLINMSVAAAGGQDAFGFGANGIIVVWYWE